MHTTTENRWRIYASKNGFIICLKNHYFKKILRNKIPWNLHINTTGNWIWKWLKNAGHFVSASVCYKDNPEKRRNTEGDAFSMYSWYLVITFLQTTYKRPLIAGQVFWRTHINSYVILMSHYAIGMRIFWKWWCSVPVTSCYYYYCL